MMKEDLKAATVGTFDGVHTGHGTVLDTLVSEARKEGLEPVAITFDRHPLEVIAPGRAPGFLIGTEEKLALLRDAGVTPVVMAFDEEMRRQTAREWIRSLHDDLGVRLLVVGYDNTFGSDGLTMSIADYRALGEEAGVKVVEAPVCPGVSSSAVRKAVAGGRIEDAVRMLGRPYRLRGVVTRGNRLGRKLGFPTANITPAKGQILPPEGVYAGDALLPDGSRRMAAVNIGRRPTVGDLKEPIIEAHILDFSGDIYGQVLKLDLIGRIRGEEKFASLDELKARLAKDVDAVRSLQEDRDAIPCGDA